MKDILILLCVLFFIASCADLPKIRPAMAPDTLAARTECCAVFPSGKWRFVHSIEAKLRAESGAAVPETEVTRAGKRFKPHPFDLDSTVKIKSELLTDFLEGAFNKAQRDGRFDVALTIDAIEQEAQKRFKPIQNNAIDTSKIDGFDQMNPEEQKEIIDYLTSVSLGGA